MTIETQEYERVIRLLEKHLQKATQDFCDLVEQSNRLSQKAHAENNALRQALKSCRKAVCEKSGYGRLTTREFAKACGVTPTQISEWTAEPILDAPDFVCRSDDFISGLDDRRQDNA